MVIIRRVLFVCLLAVILMGCSSTQLLTSTPHLKETVDDIYPGTTDGIISTSIAYPETGPALTSPAESDVEDSLIVPTPIPNRGVVVGQLVHTNTGEALSHTTIYLGEIIPLEPGPGYMLSLKERESPHTDTYADGKFAIDNIKPGTYILLVWSPFKTMPIIDTNTNEEMKIIVNDNQIIDIGTIEVIWP